MKGPLIGLCLLTAGCTQLDQQAREYLLKQYPLGMLRGEVEQRVSAQKWKRTIDETRPSDGWSSSSQRGGRQHIQQIENATGHRVEHWQQYENASNNFSLVIVGFYFDQSDRLVDIDAHVTD